LAAGAKLAAAVDTNWLSRDRSAGDASYECGRLSVRVADSNRIGIACDTRMAYVDVVAAGIDVCSSGFPDTDIVATGSAEERLGAESGVSVADCIAIESLFTYGGIEDTKAVTLQTELSYCSIIGAGSVAL
jgi:hypothetical protein